MKHHFTLFALFFLLQLLGCREEEKKVVPLLAPEAKPVVVKKTPPPPPPPAPGCQACHSKIQAKVQAKTQVKIQLDSAHDFACTDCHQGNNETNDKKLAHQDMISQAASPANMEATCGKCHAEQLERCGQSGHFTMSNAVNLVREHFDLSPLNNLTEIPE
ncbi:MAG: hypothetical protein WBM35_05945, partial [Candidatus Electrothrix sp.]